MAHEGEITGVELQDLLGVSRQATHNVLRRLFVKGVIYQVNGYRQRPYAPATPKTRTPKAAIPKRPVGRPRLAEAVKAERRAERKAELYGPPQYKPTGPKYGPPQYKPTGPKYGPPRPPQPRKRRARPPKYGPPRPSLPPGVSINTYTVRATAYRPYPNSTVEQYIIAQTDPMTAPGVMAATGQQRQHVYEALDRLWKAGALWKNGKPHPTTPAIADIDRGTRWAHSYQLTDAARDYTPPADAGIVTRYILSQPGEMTTVEIAAALDRNTNAVYRVVRRLYDKGILSRVPGARVVAKRSTGRGYKYRLTSKAAEYVPHKDAAVAKRVLRMDGVIVVADVERALQTYSYNAIHHVVQNLLAKGVLERIDDGETD